MNSTQNKCYVCGKDIKCGIKFMLDHFDAEHKLGEVKNALCDTLFEQGSITKEDYEKIIEGINPALSNFD